ncbi:MAG: signal peptidase II [Ruminococcaceae bacterium]|nr:signal peptidase II [Oscillospiraceae bacterium]
MSLILWSAIIVGSVILDQVTKFLVVRDLMPISTHMVWEGVLRFRYVENTGAAFGMLKGQRWFFIILSTIAIVGIMIYLVKCRRSIPPLFGIALAMIAGGGIGNQIDRIANGYVVDFIEFLFVDFAVFNVADCFVTVGACLLIFDMLFLERQLFLDTKTTPKKSTSATAKETDSDAVSHD